MSHVDALGVTILPGDTVTVVSWGWSVRSHDCGSRANVVGFTPAGNVRLDRTDLAGGRAVHPTNLAVARRDGRVGHEGNRHDEEA